MPFVEVVGVFRHTELVSDIDTKGSGAIFILSNVSQLNLELSSAEFL